MLCTTNVCEYVCGSGVFEWLCAHLRVQVCIKAWQMLENINNITPHHRERDLKVLGEPRAQLPAPTQPWAPLIQKGPQDPPPNEPQKPRPPHSPRWVLLLLELLTNGIPQPTVFCLFLRSPCCGGRGASFLSIMRSITDEWTTVCHP